MVDNYVINQWPTAFGPISNPSVFEVLYLVKYFGGFKYFIPHNIKNRFKNAVTLIIFKIVDLVSEAYFEPLLGGDGVQSRFCCHGEHMLDMVC